MPTSRTNLSLVKINNELGLSLRNSGGERKTGGELRRKREGTIRYDVSFWTQINCLTVSRETEGKGAVRRVGTRKGGYKFVNLKVGYR